MNRRSFLMWSGAAAGTAMLARAAPVLAQGPHAGHATGPVAPLAPPPAATDPAPSSRSFPGGQPQVVTPNGTTLPLRAVRGVKIGHLVAGEIDHEFAPGLRARAWGYNGRTPGPTIEAIEGDRVRLYVTNRLPESTSVHWHGMIVPNGMDGVVGLTQKAIPPGETWAYEFTLRHPGTFMYHPHIDEATQLALGMMGVFVVHPRRPPGPRVDRDFVLATHEWRLDAGALRPDPLEMLDFNLLTFNSKAFPATQPMLVGRGERVRIRIANLSTQDHHPIHLHGASFRVTGTDGGYVPASAQFPESTVIVPVGAVRVIELVPGEPGDWAVHCHMLHHMMTQMGHDLPVMLGADTRQLDRRMRRVLPAYMSMGTTGMEGMGEMDMPIPENSTPMRGGRGPFSTIDMGGMVTILKVRERPAERDRDGWYDHPAGTVAAPASGGQLREDGIALD
jgi:FtsP/CotA-like multicopper oxidase with cupredoxin domain